MTETTTTPIEQAAVDGPSCPAATWPGSLRQAREAAKKRRGERGPRPAPPPD